MSIQKGFSDWKKVIIMSASFGAGLLITVLIILFIFSWYQSKPKPWNNRIIAASYDYVITADPDNHFVFFYTLENKSKSDFEISSNYKIMVRLSDNTFAGEDKDSLFMTTPLFIPAKQRSRLEVHLKYTYPHKKTIGQDASKEERRQYRKEIEKYLNEEMPLLNGFTIFDESHHYQIDLPKGW
jgi:hypothetical protein